MKGQNKTVTNEIISDFAAGLVQKVNELNEDFKNADLSRLKIEAKLHYPLGGHYPQIYLRIFQEVGKTEPVQDAETLENLLSEELNGLAEQNNRAIIDGFVPAKTNDLIQD